MSCITFICKALAVTNCQGVRQKSKQQTLTRMPPDVEPPYMSVQHSQRAAGILHHPLPRTSHPCSHVTHTMRKAGAAYALPQVPWDPQVRPQTQNTCLLRRPAKQPPSRTPSLPCGCTNRSSSTCRQRWVCRRLQPCKQPWQRLRCTPASG